MRRVSLILMAVGLALSGHLYAASTNILLIIADDYGVDSSSLYNTNSSASLPPTPNIRSLATNGVLFRSAYAYPSCSPTRSCILTGRYGFRTGIGQAIGEGGSQATLPLSEFTLPEALNANPQLGYQHACIGKWHLSLDNTPTDPNVRGGWSVYSGALAGDVPNYTNWIKTVNGTVTPNYTNYATTDNVNDATNWISARGTNAWFLWLSFNAPHKPFHKPPNALHSYDLLSGTQQDINTNSRPYFEAMTEAMDTEIGRLLANVSLTNTLVIFVGDNGTTEEVIQPPFPVNRAKGTLYESGVRVPMIIAGAGVVNPGRESTVPTHCVDLYATILEAAGVNLSQTLPTNLTFDSQSLLPILRNTGTLDGRAVLCEHYGATSPNPAMPAGRCLRGPIHKLIQFQSGTNEFYNVLLDPLELTNLLTRSLTAPETRAYDLLIAISSALQSRPLLTPGNSSNQFSVTFNPVQLHTYTLQQLESLTMTNWTSLVSTTAPSSDANITLTNSVSGMTNGFYRLQVMMP